MIVRLLPFSEIDRRKAEEKQQEMREGMKIAERIDLLRETAAKEEVLVNTWHEKTVKEVQRNIQSLQVEKDSLVADIRILELRRNALREPLDDEWKEVNLLRTKLETKLSDLLQKEADLHQAIALNIQRERENKSQSESIANIKKRSTGELVMAQRDRELSQQELSAAQEKSRILNAALSLREKEASQKELNAEKALTSCFNKLKQIEEYEIALAKREQTLRAGWKNLERTKNKLSI